MPLSSCACCADVSPNPSGVSGLQDRTREPAGAERLHDKQCAARKRPRANGDHHGTRQRVGREEQDAGAELQDAEDQPAYGPSVARASLVLEGTHKTKRSHRSGGEPEDIDHFHGRDNIREELA